MKTRFLVIGIILIVAGWIYSGSAGGFNVPHFLNVPIPTIVLVLLFGSGLTMVGVFLIQKVTKQSHQKIIEKNNNQISASTGIIRI